MIYQPLIPRKKDAAGGLSEAEQNVLEALSHQVIDGRQVEPVSVGSIAMRAATPMAIVIDGINRLRSRGWAVCTGSIHLDHDDRCLLLGEGLARAAVLAAKRELALFEVQVGERLFLISYEQRAGTGVGRSRWTARAFESEMVSSPPLLEAEGTTREDARNALINRLATTNS